MSSPAPLAPSTRPRADTPVRPVSRHPGWPLTALLTLYPLWWILGMGTLIVFVLTAPMAVHLWRRRAVRVPPGFGLWLLFLLWVVLSTVMLGVDPPGTLPATAGDRIVPVLFNLAVYASVAVALLYVGNLTEEEYPRDRLVRQLGLFFVVVVAGGLLGTFAPQFQLTSVVELLLPPSVAQNSFVQSLVHPAAAQLQDVLGYTAGRPAAPFGYTNIWGYALTLLLGWFAIGWLRRPGPRRLAGVAILGLSAIPIVQSLNRGVWIGLGLMVLFAVAWMVRNGNFAAVVAVLVGLVVATTLVLATPLTGVVQDRLANPKSDGIRAFTISKTLEVLPHSPVLGFGSTRRALGSSNSIAIGRDEQCTNCGNPVIGSTGQLWQLLVSHGVVGAVLYLGYFLRTLWAFRRDRSALAGAAALAVLLPFLYMFLYSAVGVPLLITFLGIGLLWRNDQARGEQTAGAPPQPPTPVGPAEDAR